jgi:hypothetical protein
MPVDLYPPRSKPRRDEPRILDGVLLGLWGVTMIVVSMLSGSPPPLG